MKRFYCAVDKEADYVDLPDDVAAVLDLMGVELLVGIRSVSGTECYVDVYPAGTNNRARRNALLYMAPVHTEEQVIERLTNWVREGCNVERDE